MSKIFTSESGRVNNTVIPINEVEVDIEVLKRDILLDIDAWPHDFKKMKKEIEDSIDCFTTRIKKRAIKCSSYMS